MNTHYETPTFEVVEIVVEEGIATTTSCSDTESVEHGPGSWTGTATTDILA